MNPTPYSKAWESMPKRIKVGYSVYRVVPMTAISSDERGSQGLTRHLRLEIEIRPDLQPSELANTLFHEVFHAVYKTQDLEDGSIEEHVVNRVSNGMCGVMLDNPKFMPWIQSMLVRR